MKTLKIGIITGLFPAISETFVINQILTIKEVGHKVDVFCFKKSKNVLHDNSKSIKNVKELKWQKFMPQSYGLRLLKMVSILFRSLPKGLFKRFLQTLFFNRNVLNTHAFFKLYYEHYFKLENYDVLHIHFGNNAMRLIPLIRNFEQKTIVTFHGYDAHNYDAQFYSGLLETNSITYTANTEFLKQKLTKLGFLDSKIHVLTNGIDPTLFILNKKRHKTFNVLFVGRLIELKAPLLAIQIVEKVILQHNKNVRLTIIGEGEEYSICNNYIKNNNLSQYILLVGSKSQNKVIDYMNKSDVFLFPGIIDKNGRCETQGLVVQEAQAMELPVLISDVGGMQEGIIDKETGFVLKERDLEGFVVYIEYLIDNPDIKKRMGIKGREFVIKNYDSKVLRQQLLEIYQT